MPVERCEIDGRPGYRWGKEGTCYVYKDGDEPGKTRAYNQAARQGRAIKARQDGVESSTDS
jgi:hypothetical protein